MNSAALAAGIAAFAFSSAAVAQYGETVTRYTIGRPGREAVREASRAMLAAARKMREESDGTFLLKWSEKTGAPRFISGRFFPAGADDADRLRGFLRANRGLFGINDSSEELLLVRAGRDSIGYDHVRLSQYHRGVPVYAGDLVAHFDRDGALTAINGTYWPEIDVDVDPAFTADEAVAAARAELGLAEEDIINLIGPELMIYPERGRYYLAWRLRIVTSRPFAEWLCFVDAKRGVLVDGWNDAEYQTVATLSGTGVLGNGISVSGCRAGYMNSYWVDICWLFGDNVYYSGYSFLDITKSMYSGSFNGIIDTRDMMGNDPTFLYLYAYICNTTPNFNTGTWCHSFSESDFSGHYNAGKVYDYWKSHFGRTSVDGAGMDMILNVNAVLGGDPNNAMWSTGVPGLSKGATFFGAGDGILALSQAGSLDTVTHEFTHGVTNYTCALEYKNQSGAINEAFSDSFACALSSDWEYNDEGCWLASPGYLRNLRDPHLGYNPSPYSFGAYPATMDEYVQTTQDNGGVHINMTIISHCFYLLCQSVGISKGEQIWYRTQTRYCTTQTGFEQLRDLALQACRDLYGEGTEYTAVANAFADVGIGNRIYHTGDWLTVTADVDPVQNSIYGYNCYSVVTMPTAAVLTVFNSKVSPFQGPLAWVIGLPNGYPATLYSGPIPAGIPTGDYVFEVALIPAELPQSRSNAAFYSSTTVTVR